MTKSKFQSPGHTGYFRDGVRRVDMVLVVRDDGDDDTELIKINFLLNAVRLGLEMELEPGVMNLHTRLIFIKVHAPAAVVEEYGPKFGILRPYKDEHVNFFNTRLVWPCFHRLAFWVNTNEKEWIRTIRKQYCEPLSYSTLERSLIVHRIFLTLPFGKHENYVGLHTLLMKRIVLDEFPLHDGPYILAPQQTPQTYNARQMLYYKGLGLSSIMKALPLNLIHEYFGDRLGFFFAFYVYYTASFIVPAAIGARAFITELCNTTDFKDYNYTCNVIGDHYFCPQCRDFLACPFRKLKACCEAMKYHFILDQNTIFNITPYITIWAVFLVLFWRRREYYWSWMWESNVDLFEDLESPDYIGREKRDKRKNRRNLLRNLARPMPQLAIKTLIYFVCMGQWMLFALTLIIFKNRLFSIVRHYMPEENEIDADYSRHYITMAIFSVVNAMIVIILEKVCFIASYKLNDYEHHETQGSYERGLVTKIFGLTFMYSFTAFFYLAFVKGNIYRHPAHPDSWFKYDGISLMQCNPAGCLDELALAIMITLCLKQIGYKAVEGLYNLCFLRTDNNQGSALNADIPCWEREYRLTPIRDDFVMWEFSKLASQFALAIVFITGFPFAPLCILLMNMWHIKYTAWRLTLGGRRPLLQPGRGIGAWLGIFALLAVLTLIVNTSIEYITSARIKLIDEISAHLLYTLSVFHFNGYERNAEIYEAFKKFSAEHKLSSERCYFSGPYYHDRDSNKLIYQAWRSWYVIGKVTQSILHRVYTGLVLPVVIVFLIPSRSLHVEEAIYSEHRYRDLLKKRDSTSY